MNFAFVTLVVFIFFLPGFLFLASYHNGKYSRRYIKTSIFNDTSRAIIPSIIFHSLAFYTIKSLDYFETTISFRAIGVLVMGSRNDNTIETIFNDNIGFYSLEILLYLVVSAVAGFLMGRLLVNLIRIYKLDLKYEFFRFDNEWYYALSGEIIGWKRFEGIKKYKELTDENKLVAFADVLCNLNGNLIIYSGTIIEFYLDEQGLDSIYFKRCRRRSIDSDPSNPDEIIEIKGNVFILPGSDVVNLTVTYYKATKTTKNELDRIDLIDIYDNDSYTANTTSTTNRKVNMKEN